MYIYKVKYADYAIFADFSTLLQSSMLSSQLGLFNPHRTGSVLFSEQVPFMDHTTKYPEVTRRISTAEPLRLTGHGRLTDHKHQLLLKFSRRSY